MNWLQPEMLTGMAGILTAIGISLKNLAEAKAVAAEVKAISHQVHNNAGSSLKDSADKAVVKMAQMEDGFAELKEDMRGMTQTVESMAQTLQGNTRQLEQIRMDLTVQANNILRIDNESHDSHKSIYARLENLERRRKGKEQL